MAPVDVPSRSAGLRVVLAAFAGLVLTFGGTCGVGPTSLSLLAVAGTQTPSTDDVRSQVPVPAATEVAQPSRRRAARRAGGRLGRALATRARGVACAWVVGFVARRGPPPLRGPPALEA